LSKDVEKGRKKGVVIIGYGRVTLRDHVIEITISRIEISYCFLLPFVETRRTRNRRKEGLSMDDKYKGDEETTCCCCLE
jgi:hypothetical protein